MIRKLVHGLLATSLIVVVPTLGHPDVLCASKLWVLVALGVAASVFQPAHHPLRRAEPSEDQGSAATILWSVYVTQLAAILEAVYVRGPSSFDWAGPDVVALIGALAGFGVRAWAFLELGEEFTWYLAVPQRQRMVATGPYRWVRHPGYLGALLMFVSSAALVHAWTSAAAAAVVLFLAFHRRIRLEEALLGSRVSDAYLTYARQVRTRLIPGVW